jgi:hypothetical protein
MTYQDRWTYICICFSIEYIDPCYLPQVHDVCVRSIDWLRNTDPTEIPCVLVTSGYDGHVRYTDLRDMFEPIDIKTILGVPMITRCIPWADAAVYIDIDLAAKIDQLYLECRGFRLLSAKGTIWDISYSDFQPYLAAAISDGRVKITNPAYKPVRGFVSYFILFYFIFNELPKKEKTSCNNLYFCKPNRVWHKIISTKSWITLRRKNRQKTM